MCCGQGRQPWLIRFPGHNTLPLSVCACVFNHIYGNFVVQGVGLQVLTTLVTALPLQLKTYMYISYDKTETVFKFKDEKEIRSIMYVRVWVRAYVRAKYLCLGHNFLTVWKQSWNSTNEIISRQCVAKNEEISGYFRFGITPAPHPTPLSEIQVGWCWKSMSGSWLLNRMEYIHESSHMV